MSVANWRYLLRPQVLSALLTTVLGAGAMFTLYTYISPVLHTYHPCHTGVCDR